MVTDIKVQPEYVENDILIHVSADLSLGNVVLPNVALPLIIPRSGLEIGSLIMNPALGGKNQMRVSLNLSAVSKLRAAEGKLPNGGLLPLIGLTKTITIPVNDKVVIYLTLGDGVAALGVAVPFKTLDSVGSRIGTSSLFPVFNINQIFGAAGIYTSKTQGQNGFGLFADLTNVLAPVDIIDLGGDSDIRVINASSIVPPSRVEQKLNNELYNLHKARRQLRM